jgi:hypothetical protein
MATQAEIIASLHQMGVTAPDEGSAATGGLKGSDRAASQPEILASLRNMGIIAPEPDHEDAAADIITLGLRRGR